MENGFDDPSRDADEDFIFNEYAIDDTLDPLSRLVQYHQSDFSLQRLVLVRELCDTAHFAGYQESARTIVPLLSQFTSDTEPVVRQTLVQQLPALAQFFVQEGGEGGYEYVLSTFLPMGFELLVDKNVEVGSVALQTIDAMAELVRAEHVQAHLLNVVITLAHDERAEDYRVVAAQLFNGLATKFGKECCTTVVLPELELLTNDASFSVRKTVAGNLGGICKVVEDPAMHKFIISQYLSLCHDEIWGVRQACAQAIEDISIGLPEEARTSELAPAFMKMLEDNSPWVRNRAYEYLGRFIHTLRGSDVTREMLGQYVEMARRPDGEWEYFGEYCAFCFPAVLLTVGRGRWPEMHDAYLTMVKDCKWKARKSVAYSLHEVAALLGPEITESDIVPVFELLLRDLDDVKLGVVLGADKFLKLVSPAVLDRLVPLLCHVPLESENWRLRNEVAKNIGNVGTLLAPLSHSFSSVIALVLRLLDDSVMEVRASTYGPAAVILKHLASVSLENTGGYLKTICELADRQSFQGRQMFAYVAQQAAEVGADDVMESALLDGLLKLAADSVSNVRLVVSKVMNETLLVHPKWSTHAKVRAIAAALEEALREEQAQMLQQDAKHTTEAGQGEGVAVQ